MKSLSENFSGNQVLKENFFFFFWSEYCFSEFFKLFGPSGSSRLKSRKTIVFVKLSKK